MTEYSMKIAALQKEAKEIKEQMEKLQVRIVLLEELDAENKNKVRKLSIGYGKLKNRVKTKGAK